MNQASKVKTIVTTGLLLALEIIFQVLGNYLKLGPVNLNLTLVTIVLAAILCGPVPAMILGFFNGIMALLAPDTIAYFMPINPLATVCICLLKTTLAGLCASLIYKAFAKKLPILGMVLASIAVPVINTGIFLIGAILFFHTLFGYTSPSLFIVAGLIGWNFVIELASTVVVAPAAGTIVLRRENKIERA